MWPYLAQVGQSEESSVVIKVLQNFATWATLGPMDFIFVATRGRIGHVKAVFLIASYWRHA